MPSKLIKNQNLILKYLTPYKLNGIFRHYQL